MVLARRVLCVVAAATVACAAIAHLDEYGQSGQVLEDSGVPPADVESDALADAAPDEGEQPDDVAVLDATRFDAPAWDAATCLALHSVCEDFDDVDAGPP